MRKLLFALPLVAGASWAGTTYYSSSQSEPAYDRLLSQLNQTDYFKFESEEYHSGFTQSTAVTKVLLVGEESSEPMFRLQHVIDHSPVGVDNAGTRVGANSVVTTLLLESINPEFAAALNGQEPLTLHTRVDMTGNMINNLELASLSTTTNDKTIQFDGGNFEIVSELSGRIHGFGSTGNFVMTDASGVEMNIAEAPLEFDVQMLTRDIYSGSFDWNMPSIAVTNPVNGMDFNLQDLRINSLSEIQDSFMKSGMGISVGSLDAPIPMDSINWEFYMTGIPLDGITRYKELEREILASGSNDQMSPEVGDKFVEMYKSLFVPGTTVKNVLEVGNHAGMIGTDLTFIFEGDGSESGSDYMQSGRDLLASLRIDASLDADAAAINMTPLAMFANVPPASDFIINDGVKYTADLSFDDLILYVNGSSIDVIEQFGLSGMIDQPLDFLGTL